MAALIDANVIIRFLVGDHEAHLKKSTEIFEAIESGSMEVEILDIVLLEVLYVMTKFYKLPRSGVVNDLKTMLALEGVVNADKIILFEALTLFETKNIDFVDAVICAKSQLQGYSRISFDKDAVVKCDK